MADCLIALGSNVGDRAAQLDQAVERLCSNSRVSLRGRAVYSETTPVGGPKGQQSFLNSAVRVITDLSPEEMLAWTKQIERDLGRERLERWGPRTIDIDVLMYDLLVLDAPDLILPHPRMAMRRFVLQSACEVAADMIHAPTGWSIQRLLARLDETPHYVAVCCADQVRSAQLVATAADRLSATRLTVASDTVGEQEGETTPATLQAALNSLATQSKSLRTIGANCLADELFLSDFWLNQSLALVRTWPHGSKREQFQRACESAIEQAPQPRFILHLDMRPSAPPTLEPYRLQLRRQLAIAEQGPVLSVPAEDLDAAFIELQAGIDAMR